MNPVAWRNAVFAVFALNGVGMATWTSRLPVIREDLGLSLAQMGVLIVGLPLGGLVGVLLTSHVLHWLGARATVRSAILLTTGGMLLIGLASTVAASPLLAFAGVVVFGFGNGVCNIAINVEGAAAERANGRTLMPAFHASWSIGTFLGAGLGALASLLHLPVVAHTAVIALVMLAVILPAAARFPVVDVEEEHASRTTFRARMGVWLEPRTLLLGVVVLGMSFTEGSANNWLALAVVDDRGLSAATGAAFVALFTGSMTTGRLLGGWVLDRFGRVRVLRASLGLALVGVVLVITVAHPAATVVGVVLWGLGASLGTPVAMSAAADDPRGAAARVSAISTVASLSALAGPPVIGLLGEHVGLLNAFALVVGLILVAVSVSGAVRRVQVSGTPVVEDSIHGSSRR